MGLFRRKDERAIPKPGTPEFDAAVEGTALPDDQSVSMGEAGWTKPGPEPARETEPGPETEQPVAEQGLEDEEQPADQLKPKKAGLIIRGMARGVPNQGGFGAGIPGPGQRRKDD